jgi:hypothetical protein
VTFDPGDGIDYDLAWPASRLYVVHDGFQASLNMKCPDPIIRISRVGKAARVLSRPTVL